MKDDDHLMFVVGEEKGPRELLGESDVLPLLKGLVAAGASSVRVEDERGECWSLSDSSGDSAEEVAALPLRLEGEPVAQLRMTAPPEKRAALVAAARLVQVALETVLINALKRVLTTEIHTKVVASSYDELVKSYTVVAESEARYRELAQDLELRVKERSEELHRARAAMLQQEQMAAVGQLAAGVAHEINNPLGFVISNLHTLGKYLGRLTAMIDWYREQLKQGHSPRLIEEEAQRKWQELRLALVFDDAGDLLSQSLSGLERVSRIVADLKGFSHVDDAAEGEVDLNAELERTLSVLSHQLGQGAEVVKRLEPLPPVRCQPQLPGQIFLNLIQNALAACPQRLRLTLASSWDGREIRIRIADNGPGVPAQIRERIFEPFFTTQPVGAGTGLGLTVVYDSVRKLEGSITVSESPEGGAEFVVTIPKG